MLCTRSLLFKLTAFYILCAIVLLIVCETTWRSLASYSTAERSSQDRAFELFWLEPELITPLWASSWSN